MPIVHRLKKLSHASHKFCGRCVIQVIFSRSSVDIFSFHVACCTARLLRHLLLNRGSKQKNILPSSKVSKVVPAEKLYDASFYRVGKLQNQVQFTEANTCRTSTVPQPLMLNFFLHGEQRTGIRMGFQIHFKNAFLFPITMANFYQDQEIFSGQKLHILAAFHA